MKARNKTNVKTKRLFKLMYWAASLSTLALFIFTAICAAVMPDSFTFTDGATAQNCAPIPALTIVKNSDTEEDGGKLVFANIFPVKDVSITSREDIKVIPGGTPFGVRMFTHGVMAVKTEVVSADGKCCCPAGDGGIEVGDTIISVDGISVTSNSQLSKLVNESGGEEMTFSVKRNDKTFTTEVTPIKTAEDEYKIGLWVRDSSAGIGTITFYCEDNSGFAGLGHGICDVDTGELMPLDHGDIVQASIDTVTRGLKGSPGSLNGHFKSSGTVGNLNCNNETGVYGTVQSVPDGAAVSVASVQEVQTGCATVLTTVSGETPEEYSIEIESIGYDENNKTKNMVIRITDERLLESTGGIVQGMSGSPILQNGKLVGAVTHVFVNAPDKGYAIFAENMLSDYANATGLYVNEAA